MNTSDLKFLPLLVFLMCTPQQGKNQSTLAGWTDSLSPGLIDTSAFLERMLSPIGQEAEGSAKQLSAGYQSLAHRYGFRFEDRFGHTRGIFSYHALIHELFVMEDPGGDLDIYSVVKPECQPKFAPIKMK
ncbi:MAG TPA: hypothetical protein PKE06_09370 [Flavilitoribacter sp.]|nr:hypothetical protein [Flavilitoribacter sp.]HMQ88235.1 hypothetical protein [Flavilitoribacter sp.]